MFDLTFYALSKDGRFGSGVAYEGYQYAVADANGARLLKSAYLYKASERHVFPAFSCRRA